MFRDRPKIVVEWNVPEGKMDINWWAKSATEQMKVESPCKETSEWVPIDAPTDVKFQLQNNPGCDGCHYTIGATKPKGNEHIRLQFGKKVTLKGGCPFIRDIQDRI